MCSTNIVDIAPQYSSVVTGLTNTFATLPGIISPTLTGFIVQTAVKIEKKKLIFALF